MSLMASATAVSSAVCSCGLDSLRSVDQEVEVFAHILFGKDLLLNLVQDCLFKFTLVEERCIALFTTSSKVCAARIVVVLARFGSGAQIVMTAEVTYNKPTQQVFRAMGKGILKFLLFGFESFLDPLKEALVDDRRIKSRDSDRLSFAPTLVPVVV